MKLLNIKCVFFSLQILPETFFILRKTRARHDQKCMFVFKYPLLLSYFNAT